MPEPSSINEPDEDELDEEEQAERQRRSEIARQIETAFASLEYPGDTRLVENAADWESPEVLAAFQGKRWDELSVDILFEQRLALPLLTPEAFRYYLPAFLRAAVLYPDQVDTLTENTFFFLTPPPEEAENKRQKFANRTGAFDLAQRAAISSFVKLYADTETSYPDPDRDRAAAFWIGSL